MHKIIYTSNRLCGSSVTRLTGRREYVHVGLTAAIPAADTCQSSHRTPFQSRRRYFMFVPNFMKVWGVASEDVGSRADFCSTQNLHSRHPWRSIAAVKPPWVGLPST